MTNGLEVAGLIKDFGDRRVLGGVTITASAGEFVTLLGPSGCGKTTSLRCIAGLESPDAGAIRINDRAVFSGQDNVDLFPERRRIGMVFQNYAVWPHMTVFQNVAYPLKMQRLRSGELRARVDRTLELVGLTAYSSARISTLSGGQQQRVGLARALVAQPDLLLFDEPLSNLDSRLREQLRDEIGRLQRDSGTTAVYVTHDQSEAMALSDRIYVMRDGQVAQEGKPADIFERPETEFVARFVGMDNFARGVVVGSADGSSSVRIHDTGELLRASGEQVAGSEVLLGFRSAVSRILPLATQGEVGGVRAVAERFTDLGDVLEWTLVRPNGQRLKVRVPRGWAHHDGSSVRAGDDVAIVPGESRVVVPDPPPMSNEDARSESHPSPREKRMS